MAKRGLLLVVVAMVGMAAFAEKPEDVLFKADRDFCHDVQVKRLDGFMAWIAPGIVTFGSTSLKGVEEVRKSWKEAFDDANFQLSWEPVKADMFPSGNMGYTVGRYVLRGKSQSGPTERQGTYLTVWQKQEDGSWKVLADGGSSDGAIAKD